MSRERGGALRREREAEAVARGERVGQRREVPVEQVVREALGRPDGEPPQDAAGS